MSTKNKKNYTLTHDDTGWEITIAIDEANPIAKEAMQQTVDFWSGGDGRLDRHDGDYKHAFLYQLAATAACIAVEYGGAKALVRELGTREGWPPLDGSKGIEIIEADRFIIDEEDFTLDK